MDNKTELVQLIHEIMSTSACRVDFDALLRKVEKYQPKEDVTRLIFDPPNGKPLTPEEIVARAFD